MELDARAIEAEVLEARRARLAGKVALVTGGAGGVGRGIGQVLAQAGTRVLLADRDREAAERAAAELAADGAELFGHGLDVTDEAQVGALIEATVRRFGRVDLVCCNAGTITVMPFLEMPVEAWRREIEVNLNGAFICARAAARRMRRQAVDPQTGRRGAIVLTSSPAADGGTPSHPAYGPSKAGVSNLAKTAAAALAGDLISVTAFYPGNVWEGMQSQLERDLTESRGLPPGERAREKLEAWPSGRWQRPTQAGEIVAFIAARVGMELNGQLVISHPHVRPL